MVAIYVAARIKKLPRQPKARWRERLRLFRDALWGLLLIVIVMGGIYGGVFTPTEAAAVAAVYAFFAAVFIYRDLHITDVPRVLLDSGARVGDADVHHRQRLPVRPCADHLANPAEHLGDGGGTPTWRRGISC